MLSKGAGEKKERVRERAKERERERERERSWQGVRTRFESAFRRKVWPFRLLPFVTFAASAPACKRAESCLRAQITVEPQLFVVVSFPPFFHSVRRHTRTPTTPMISRFGNRTCMYIYIVERRCIIALCTRKYTYGQYAYLCAIVTQLANAHWRFHFCLQRCWVGFTRAYFETQLCDSVFLICCFNG